MLSGTWTTSCCWLDLRILALTLCHVLRRPQHTVTPVEPALAASSRTSQRTAIAGALIFILAAAICLATYLALTSRGAWFGGPPALRWAPADFKVTRGTARPAGKGLLLLSPDATGTVVVSFNTSFRSSDYPVIAWDAANVPEGVELGLLWNTAYMPSRMFSRPLAVEAGRIAPADLAADRGWIGTISGLAIAMRGSFTEPILLRSVTAKPMTPGAILFDRVREWVAFESWNGTSINSVTGGASVQELPLPALLATVVVVAALLYTALARWTPAVVGSFRPAVVATMFLAAWLVLDARWQWNLLRQVRATYEQYAGKSWRERHLAAEDGSLFAFIEKVRAKLPPVVEPTARVFMVADANYFRGRGAYHLYPYNVYFDPLQNTMPPSSALRSGDYLVAYRRGGLQFDPAQQRLRWEGGEPIAAELLLVDAGAAMFRIR